MSTKFTEIDTAAMIRAFHVAQAKFWQDQAAFEYEAGARPQEARFRTYWQSMSADSYRRARHHARKLINGD